MASKSVGAKGRAKAAKVMGEFKARTLKSGSGKIVTNPRHAVAIAASEARKVSGVKRPK